MKVSKIACADCGTLVTKLIGDICPLCYNLFIKQEDWNSTEYDLRTALNDAEESLKIAKEAYENSLIDESSPMSESYENAVGLLYFATQTYKAAKLAHERHEDAWNEL